jgi:hypothetical protein
MGRQNAAHEESVDRFELRAHLVADQLVRNLPIRDNLGRATNTV